jgi:O-acetyl-ADP-ribose deacetylase (regulator of RNase III)
MEYTERKGDLIVEAKAGAFDVIGHGCNCYCNMGAGIAVPMAKVFGADKYVMERGSYKGDYNKLGQIDFGHTHADNGKYLYVVNCYTQFRPGKDLDYDALRLCLRKLNREFRGMHVGLPKIGCGLAGGDWNTVSAMIKEEMKDCKVTVVVL